MADNIFKLKIYPNLVVFGFDFLIHKHVIQKQTENLQVKKEIAKRF